MSSSGLIAEVAPEVAPGIHLLPVVHQAVELAAVARSVCLALEPAAVAVELPTTLRDAVLRAILRLPELSMVIAEPPGEGEATVWCACPGDPFAEALRWALAEGREVALVDPDLDYEGRHRDRVPDPAALEVIGAGPYLGELVAALDSSEAEVATEDRLRERGMAYHLQSLRERVAGGPILALVGAAHAARLARALRVPAPVPFARPRRTRVEVRNLHPDDLCAVLEEPPLLHALWELLRADALPPEPPFAATVAPRRALDARAAPAPPVDPRLRAEALVAWIAHQAVKPSSWGGRGVDRQALERAVWRVGAASFTAQTREETRPWQRRIFHDFTRRMSALSGRLSGRLWAWTAAARGVGDDNLAWEVFDVARTYPAQRAETEIPTARVEGDELKLGTRTLRFRRRFFQVKRRLVRVRTRPEPEDPADWLEAFEGEMICSYPPEDLVIEDFGRFLQRKAVSILAAQNARTEPFSTSFLDGVDIRETLRNVHESRIYVREMRKVPGGAGSVVVIFDHDPAGTEYPYLMTWLGEHEEESDMAFYASDPAAQVVGPGILRATYGGLMMSLPPRRVYDVWRDPDYARARDKAEVLVMAAVDYSTERLVVHVAAKAPSERMRRYATARGKRLVHIPLGSLSPQTLRKIRVVHLLAGPDKRAVAPHYVW